MNSVVLFQQLFNCSRPGNYKLTQSDFNSHIRLTEQTWIKVKTLAHSSYSLESCTEGFVFPYKGYSDQAIPLLTSIKENTILSTISLLSGPAALSHLLFIKSKLTWKLTGGGGFFGSILTTLDSTFGGGRKLFFPT